MSRRADGWNYAAGEGKMGKRERRDPLLREKIARSGPLSKQAPADLTAERANGEEQRSQTNNCHQNNQRER